MNPPDFGGMWIIFPIIMIPTMLAFMYFMFVRGGRRPPWQDTDRGYREPEAQRGAGAPQSALDILNRRYAAGEITKEEFDQMKQDLA